MIHEGKKPDKWNFTELKKSLLCENIIKGLKSLTERKYLQNTYLMKNLYLKCTKNSLKTQQ